MARVSNEAFEKLTVLLDALPDEIRNKCTLCNETLVHQVKQAEANSGAPTATVTRELAKRVNKGAAPGDRVSGDQLRGRVQRAEGICTQRANKPQPDAPAPSPSPSPPTSMPSQRSTPNEAAIRPKDPPGPEGNVNRTFLRLYKSLCWEIKKERENWSLARYEAVLAHIEHLRALIQQYAPDGQQQLRFNFVNQSIHKA